MNLRIIRIADRGVPNKERLHITALAAADLNYYLILNTTRIGNGLSPLPLNALWFGPYSVNKGDNIVIYTGPGTASRSKRADGGEDHFLYWGLRNTIWQDPNTCAVLMAISAWETSAPEISPEVGTSVGLMEALSTALKTKNSY
jgi:hypothetical protein